jgi:hypothetical protein
MFGATGAAGIAGPHVAYSLEPPRGCCLTWARYLAGVVECAALKLAVR